MKSHFYRIIKPYNVEDGNLGLPPQFVEEHGKNLSKNVSLKVEDGAPHRVSLKWIDGKLWLHKGWPEFTHRYSIECYYILVFKYEGGSAFQVFIYGTDCTLIEYPVTDDDDFSADQSPQKNMKDKEPLNLILSSSGFDESVARERTIRRAKAVNSPHPHFISVMQKTYLSRSFLYIPECEVSKYFHGRKETDNIQVNGLGRDWLMKYYITSTPQKQVRISRGWRQFANEGKLKDGDVCLFELVNSNKLGSRDVVMEYKVTVFPL